jgi:hypothetical protein
MHPAPGTIRVTTDAGVTRLINGGRYKVRTVQSILHVQRQVPTGPEPVLLTELGRDELSPLEQKMHNLLQERPCWTRTALLNQLSADDHKVINAYVVCVFFAVACVLSPASWELTRIRISQEQVVLAHDQLHLCRRALPRPRHPVWLRPAHRPRSSLVRSPLSFCAMNARS